MRCGVIFSVHCDTGLGAGAGFMVMLVHSKQCLTLLSDTVDITAQFSTFFHHLKLCPLSTFGLL